MSIDQLVEIINAVTFVAFIALLALAVMRMAIRLIFYTIADRRASIILRRDFILMGALLLIFGAPVVIGFFNWGELVMEGGPLRLPYALVRNIIGLGALAYWVWAEYFVIGRPGREND